MPSDAGVDDAPELLADGIVLAPLADRPAPPLGEGADGAPLAENGLGFAAGVAGITVGRRAAWFAKKSCCEAVATFGPRFVPVLGVIIGGIRSLHRRMRF